jgi:hypothetical protein
MHTMHNKVGKRMHRLVALAIAAVLVGVVSTGQAGVDRVDVDARAERTLSAPGKAANARLAQSCDADYEWTAIGSRNEIRDAQTSVRNSAAVSVQTAGSESTAAKNHPEPETMAMFVAGLALMGFVARRRQSRAST